MKNKAGIQQCLVHSWGKRINTPAGSQGKCAVSYKKSAALITMLAIFMLLFAGCSLLPAEEEELAPPLNEHEEVTYKTIEVKKQDVFENRLICIGTVVSAIQKKHFFEFRGGRLKGIYVKPGDRVEKGDLLAELDTDSLGSQIKQQEIVLQRAKVSYEQLKSSGMLDIEAASLQLADLKRRYDRMKSKPDASLDEIESLQSQIGLQEINLRKLKLAYGTDKGAGGGYALQQAAAGIEEAELRLEELKTEFEKSRLVADVAGEVVYAASIRNGEYINAYDNVITIADPRRLQIQYTGDRVSDFTFGKVVGIKINDKSCTGKVVMAPDSIPADSDESLKGLVLISVDRMPEEAKIDGTANIEFVLEKSMDTIVLRKTAINRYGGKTVVYVLQDGMKVERNVETGIETAAEVEIIKGLEVGEKVIIE